MSFTAPIFMKLRTFNSNVRRTYTEFRPYWTVGEEITPLIQVWLLVLLVSQNAYYSTALCGNFTYQILSQLVNKHRKYKLNTVHFPCNYTWHQLVM